VDGSQFTLSNEAKILFEAAGTDNSDDLYFDQIRVTGIAETVPLNVPGLAAWAMAGLAGSLGIVGLSAAQRRGKGAHSIT